MAECSVAPTDMQIAQRNTQGSQPAHTIEQ